jgi:hypothetical protein
MHVAVLYALLIIVLVSSFPRAFAGVATEMNSVGTHNSNNYTYRETVEVSRDGLLCLARAWSMAMIEVDC